MSQPDLDEAPPRRDGDGDGVGQAVLSGALAVLLLGLCVAQRLTAFDGPQGHYWAIRAWIYAPLIVFAVIVLLRGRTVARRLLAFVFACAIIALDYWWQHRLAYRVYREIDPNSDLGGFIWVLQPAVLVLLLCLAWGIARRRGGLWPLGPLVAAVALGIVVHQEVIMRRLPDQQTPRDIVLALVIPVAVWLGCLLGWLIDKATERTRSRGRVYPAMGHTDSPFGQP